MLSCKDIADQASAVIDGELNPGQRWRVRLHLLICVHCRRFLRQFRLSSDAAKSVTAPPPPLPETQVQAILQRLGDQKE